MARDAISIVAPTVNAATAWGAGTTITPANDAVVSPGGNTQNLFLRITNTHGSDHTVTIKAGDNPPAFRSGLGDLTVTVPATSGDVLIPLESARFVQSDGTIEVDFETDHAGKAYAVRLPGSV